MGEAVHQQNTAHNTQPVNIQELHTPWQTEKVVEKKIIEWDNREDRQTEGDGFRWHPWEQPILAGDDCGKLMKSCWSPLDHWPVNCLAAINKITSRAAAGSKPGSRRTYRAASAERVASSISRLDPISIVHQTTVIPAKGLALDLITSYLSGSWCSFVDRR